LGIVALIAFAWAISENRRRVSLRRIGVGLAVAIVLAVVFLKIPPVTRAFGSANHAIDAIAAASRAGTSFVFGYIGGGALPFELKFPGKEFVLAFNALPIVLVMSVLTTLLFYWGILPPIVKGFAFALNRTMGIGGAVGLSTAANIFVGHVEAPLFIRPYLAQLSRSELFIVMTGGMAGIAGTVLVLYAQFLRDAIPDAAGHLIIASVLGAPIAVMIGQIMIPDEHDTRTSSLEITEPVAESTIDAIAKGATTGLALLLNMIAMLIVFVALVALANIMLGALPQVGGDPITLERILGLVMAPVCWLIGIPWSQAVTAGTLMGIKTVLNELIAYLHMSRMPADALDPRSRLIMVYAMCGFANFGSVGIMIGGLTVMAPERRSDVISLGMKSMVSGTIATLLMGAIVGLLT
jgi:CNT family concentrative nucleoside transporter